MIDYYVFRFFAKRIRDRGISRHVVFYSEADWYTISVARGKLHIPVIIVSGSFYVSSSLIHHQPQKRASSP